MGSSAAAYAVTTASQGVAGWARVSWDAMTPLKTKILIADDHPIVVRGLRIVLDAQPDLEVAAAAGDGDEAVRLALTEDVQLAILTSRCPDDPDCTRHGRSPSDGPSSAC